MPYGRLSRPKPKPKPNAALELMGRDYDPPYGSTGAWTVPRPPEPQPIVTPRFQVPPVDWELEAAERRERGEEPASSGAPGPSAVEAMMHQARERGELEEPPPLGPPVEGEPLRRPVVPEVDWRLEEFERREREDR
jgi:hypothetical protein